MHIPVKETLSKLDLEPKCQIHCKNKKTITYKTKIALLQKFSRDSPSINCCETDVSKRS